MTHNQDPREPKDFSSMDDHDNDGWNNSTIEPPDRIPVDDEQIEDEEDLDYSPNEDF